MNWAITTDTTNISVCVYLHGDGKSKKSKAISVTDRGGL
jgi:hypothetical protein